MLILNLPFAFGDQGFQDTESAPQGPVAIAYRKCIDKQLQLSCINKYGSHMDENPGLSRQGDSAVVDACIKAREVNPGDADKCFKEAMAASPSDNLPPTKPPNSQQASEIKPTKPTTNPTTTATKPPTQNANQKPTSSASAADVQAQINQDVATCQNLQSQATKCCGNPLSCAGSLSSSDQSNLAKLMQAQNGPAQGQGLTDYCKQMEQASTNAGSVNNGLATLCATNQISCRNSCDSLANKYTDLANANIGTNLESLYASAIDQLNVAVSICENLQGKANQLATQGMSSGTTNNYAQNCQQLGAAAPQNMGGVVVPNTANSAALLNTQANCTTNPNSAECKNQNQPVAGTGGFDTSAQKEGSFDVPDVGTMNGTLDNQIKGQSNATIRSVPNNSGGGIPGASSGGSSTQAQLGGGTRPSPGAPGYTTDILQGERSGGYTSSGSGFDDNSSGSTARYGAHRPAVNNDDGGLLGMDLRQYLPGGSLAHRQLAGINGRSEINAKEEDIWRRISNKIIEKCKLGVLWRCQ